MIIETVNKNFNDEILNNLALFNQCKTIQNCNCASKIIEISAKEFNAYSKRFDNATFYQTSNWANLKASTGWKALYIIYKEEYEVKGCGLFLLKKMPFINSYLAYTPRGFLINYNDLQLVDRFLKELIPFLKIKHIFMLIMDPYVLLNHRDINGDIINDGYDNHKLIDKLNQLGFKHTGYNLYYENLAPRFLFRLNLKDKTYDELLNNFKKEAKRRALKKDYLGIEVRELKENEVETFKNLMEMTSNRKGFIDRPLSYYKQMYASLNPDGILRYMVAELDIDKCKENINNEIKNINKKIEKLKLHEQSNLGKIKEEFVSLKSNLRLLDTLAKLDAEGLKKVPLSVVCLLSYGKEAIMLLAGNDENYLQHFNASNIIVSELIKLVKQEGYDYYNFYGITGNFNKNSKDYGLYAYKKQYGGEVIELVGQFEYIINPVIKSLYEFLLGIYKLTKKIG